MSRDLSGSSLLFFYLGIIFRGSSGFQASNKQQRWLQTRLRIDRKSTRLNSSHTVSSYAVFCFKKKQIQTNASAKRSIRGARADGGLLLLAARPQSQKNRQSRVNLTSANLRFELSSKTSRK